MFSLSSLIPSWWKIAVVGLVLALGVTAIYQWRADIRTAAFDHIFKEQVTGLLKEQDDRWREREDILKTQQRNLETQLAAQRKITEKFRLADEEFRKQGFQNNPADPALTYTFDQIRRMEEAKRGVAAPAQTPKSASSGSSTPTLDQWKAQQKK